MNDITKHHIYIGVEDAEQGFERFIKVWHQPKLETVKVHLNFEDFSKLASLLTPKRRVLLKTVRQCGSFSIQVVAKQLQRDYKNVHVDVVKFEAVDLIYRNDKKVLLTP